MIQTTITVDAAHAFNKIKNFTQKMHPIALQAAAMGVRVALDKHILMRQSEPRKDGFPMQGFWVGNNGRSVREAIQPTEYNGDTATIRIKSAPLAHKVDTNPPPITPKGGKKYLTIPALAEASGLPAGNFNLKFGYRKKDGSVPKDGERGFPALFEPSSNRIFYWLARKVQTPHDPRAMPDEKDLQQTAVQHAEAALKKLVDSPS